MRRTYALALSCCLLVPGAGTATAEPTDPAGPSAAPTVRELPVPEPERRDLPRTDASSEGRWVPIPRAQPRRPGPVPMPLTKPRRPGPVPIPQLDQGPGPLPELRSGPPPRPPRPLQGTLPHPLDPTDVVVP